jgi:hypothetical protein
MPFASSLIGYLLFFGVSLRLWAKAKKQQTIPALLFTCALAVSGLIVSYTFVNDPAIAYQSRFSTLQLNANQPIGIAIGIFPGRVVWVHRPEATNESCNPAAVGHEWYRPENNDQLVIDSMVSTAIRRLTGTSSDAAAWDAIFRFHNSARGKGAVGYTPGEKIFVKTNAVSSWNGNFSTVDLTPATGVMYYGVTETSPAIILSVLRQLVNVAGVAQADIYVGDPMRHIYKHCYDLWHVGFPDVHYLDVDGYTHLGREKAVKSTTARIQYSDRGTVLKINGTSGAAVTDDYLYAVFDQAEYLLNVPMLKGHKRAGATMFAKNHFGSHTRSSATHLHGGLVAPDESPTRPGYGLYRVQVDMLGHQLLGRKNLIYLMDALWATDYELDVPLKWMMAPFNNDWMSSVFASFDPLAIESVGYDFLRTEFTAERGAGTYVQMNGTDDYLHQAADSTAWPAGISYDPENDGTVLGSLGTHEHWNDGLRKQYSRNLGTGNGIELVGKDQMVFVKALLEGPYAAGTMSTAIQMSGHVPLMHPYGGAPWSHAGSESVVSIPSDVVDWILVELRTEIDNTSRAGTRAAFIMSDGSVVDLDGTNPVAFPSVPDGEYYVVLHHRNHLAIMSSTALTLDGDVAVYDFTTAVAKAYGPDAMKMLESGIYGMYAGDADGSSDVAALDRTATWNDRNQTGYLNSEVDLSGDVGALDRTITWNNRNRSTKVP